MGKNAKLVFVEFSVRFQSDFRASSEQLRCQFKAILLDKFGTDSKQVTWIFRSNSRAVLKATSVLFFRAIASSLPVDLSGVSD